MCDRVRRGAGLTLLLAACACALALAVTAWPRPQAADGYAPTGRTASVLPVEGPKGTVSVNLAEAEDLLALPGVGETLAGEILAERDAHGWYYYPEDLLAARGVGPSKLAGFRDLLDMTVPEE